MKEREPSSLKASCRINSQQEQKVLRQEKQVLHTPREQVKQKGFPAGSVKIFINGLIGKFLPTTSRVPAAGAR